jgi:drug/metabolite transporter (DMT)-like permease
MPRRHAVLALVVAVCWAVNFVVIDIGLRSFPPLLFAALGWRSLRRRARKPGNAVSPFWISRTALGSYKLRGKRCR